ncbi:MAG TPA: YbaB/EbfC family nucleoid-associated protein [Patescibacteria group bacterium]|nr:YbaB/EbfC family nucleoid-associated protein [Patescibacteria group bacterium]
MFNPLKNLGELNELRKQAMALQAALKQILITEEKGRAHVELSADMKVHSVKINGEEMNDLKDCLNDAIEKAQKKAAAKMQEMGGGLGGLLGGGQ